MSHLEVLAVLAEKRRKNNPNASEDDLKYITTYEDVERRRKAVLDYIKKKEEKEDISIQSIKENVSIQSIKEKIKQLFHGVLEKGKK